MKKTLYRLKRIWETQAFVLTTLALASLIATGCDLGTRNAGLAVTPYPEGLMTHCPEGEDAAKTTCSELKERYDAFYEKVLDAPPSADARNTVKTLDVLPRSADGNVNWTTSVAGGYISPRGTIYPASNTEAEDPPLNLNIIIKSKDPVVSDVLFPHAVHTYWLDCKSCHPKIFVPKAGGNHITMDGILNGKWCGRCHGKVSFDFWPRSNCKKCHISIKEPAGEADTKAHR